MKEAMSSSPAFRHFGITVVLSMIAVLTLPLAGFVGMARADPYSIQYPFCNINIVEITTTPGETTDGMVSVTLGGGDAYSTACDGYTGYVGLTVLGGSASGQLVAVALDGESATGTNAGVTIAPSGYAHGGAVNIGCTTDPAGGVNVQWCGVFQTQVSPILQAGLSPYALDKNCDTQLTYTLSGVGIRTIDFDSHTECDGTQVLMDIKTELRLVTTNSLEASGTPFTGLSSDGRSSGSFPFAVAGTQHKLTSFTRLTTVDTSVWAGTDPRCVGWGTISIYCVLSTVFTV